MDCRIGYVIVGVKSLERGVEFYRDTMGFEFQFMEPEMHFAGFRVGEMMFNLAEAPETHGSGDRNTGIGFAVDASDEIRAQAGTANALEVIVSIAERPGRSG